MSATETADTATRSDGPATRIVARFPNQSAAEVIVTATGSLHTWRCVGCSDGGGPIPVDLRRKAAEHADGCRALPPADAGAPAIEGIRPSTPVRLLSALDWFDPCFVKGPVQDWVVLVRPGGADALRALIEAIGDGEWRELGQLALAKGRATGDRALEQVGQILADPADFAALFLAMPASRQYQNLRDLCTALETH